MIDELEIDDEHNRLASTPEGKLLLAILIKALEDLDRELKRGKPLYMLNWFYSDSEVFELACHVMGWHKDVFRKRLAEKIKTGSVMPIEGGISERSIRRRRQKERERAMMINTNNGGKDENI